MITSLVGTLVSLIWRAYSGVDRVAIFGGVFWQWLTRASPDSLELVDEELGVRGINVPAGTCASHRQGSSSAEHERRIHGANVASRTLFTGNPDEDPEDPEESDLDEPDEPVSTDNKEAAATGPEDAVLKRTNTEETETLSDI